MSKKGGTTTHIDLPEVWTTYEYTFTEDERRALADDLAMAVSNVDELKEEKKAAMADFKARIDAINASIKEISNKLNKGTERRDILAHVQKDFESRIKTFFDVETGDVIKEVPFTFEDLQRSMDDA